MNWIDISIILTSGLGLLVGWRVGLLGATFTSAGIVIGASLAGSLNSYVSDLILEFIDHSLVATILSYAIIFSVVFAISQTLKSLFKNFLKMVFLGWIDTIGSVLLGFIIAIVLSSTLVSMLAKYSGDLTLQPSESNPNLGDVLIDSTGIPQDIRKALIESNLVSVLLDMRKAVPGDVLSFIPGDFNKALDSLEDQINNK